MPFGVLAQTERSYRYDAFSARYEVQRNASVRVQETITYAFTGLYHQGYRAIPHAGSGAITDIKIVDKASGQPLTYIPTRLDKTDPASWGKYTTYDENGSKVVEWYYDLADTTHTWVLSYTLHGAVSFYTDHDELYWNVFSGLDAPVNLVQATVVLPEANTQPSSRIYLADAGHEETVVQEDPATTVFTAKVIASQAPVTIALGWQKGLIVKREYWIDWLSTNWYLILSALVVLLASVFCVLYWFFKEKYPHIGEVIVAEYEPPFGLPPLEAELLIRESTSQRAWPATAIDLAVRGHLEIKELPRQWYSFGNTYFEIRKKETADSLRPYESSFIDALFLLPSSVKDGVFSTKALAWNTTEKRMLYLGLKSYEKDAMKEVDDTHAFARTLTREKQGKHMLFAAIGICAAAIFVLLSYVQNSSMFLYSLPVLSIFAATMLVFYTTRYEARRSPEGEALRKKWLGFKLYLKTAERYRLQNLTPETFEKYLPYAMIFGIEKKWAKNFESMNVASPAWYVGPNYGVGASSAFSPSSFAGSFSASFASSFASSGGGGASGGGGGAGGGGGGGGGGAG